MTPTSQTHPAALAAFPGARAYRNTRSFSRVLREVLDDSDRSVSIAYTPRATATDGTRHKLRVRTAPSETGLRYPKGYFNLSFGRCSCNTEMATALRSPFDAAELKLHVQLRPHAQATGAYELSVYVDTPGGASRRWNVMVAEMPGDLRTKLMEQTSGQPSRESAMDEASNHGVWLRRWFLCSANTRWARVVVQDMTSGALGSVTIPLTAHKP